MNTDHEFIQSSVANKISHEKNLLTNYLRSSKYLMSEYLISALGSFHLAGYRTTDQIQDLIQSFWQGQEVTYAWVWFG